MNCKHCDITMRLIERSDRFVCETCHHSEPATPVSEPEFCFPVELMNKITTFLCPSCDESQLEVGRIEKTQVCACRNCSGFAIDRASFGELVEALRSRYDGLDSVPVLFDPQHMERQMNCVACQNQMKMILYCGPGNVVVATCETCKTSWLNSETDFDRIIRAPGKRSYEYKLPEYSIINGMFGTGIAHYG